MISNHQIALCIHQDNEMANGRWLWSPEEFNSNDMEAVRDIETAVSKIRLLKTSAARIMVCDANNGDDCCISCTDGLIQMLNEDFLMSDVKWVRVSDDTLLIQVARGGKASE